LEKVSFQEELCKGCKLCVNACPQKIIKLADHFNSMGYHPATVKLQEKCRSCAFCAMVCPDIAIMVTKESKA
jgi:2-oxoglutarate ferredoxin oxidoreductase subunit delta